MAEIGPNEKKPDRGTVIVYTRPGDAAVAMVQTLTNTGRNVEYCALCDAGPEDR
jgi:hypothetical protein